MQDPRSRPRETNAGTHTPRTVASSTVCDDFLKAHPPRIMGPGVRRDDIESEPHAAALCRTSSAWYSLNSSATALAMLGRARKRS